MSGQPASVDPGAHWYSQYRKQRRRTRVLALSTVLLAIACVLLGGTSLALLRANDLANEVSGVLPGVSGILGNPGQADPEQANPGQAIPDQESAGDDSATSGSASAADLAELSELVAGLKNADGSLNPLGVAALAGKLGTLAKDPQQLNSLIDQAQQQGLIDSQVAGLLRGVLAGTATAG
jgi:hypothetical protein